MTTSLTKRVARLTDTSAPYKGGKRKSLVVELQPGDVIEFRLQGTRQRIGMSLLDVYYVALKLRAVQIKFERAAKRKAAKVAR